MWTQAKPQELFLTNMKQTCSKLLNLKLKCTYVKKYHVIYLSQLNTILKVSPEPECSTELEEELVVMFSPSNRATGLQNDLRFCSLNYGCG